MSDLDMTPSQWRHAQAEDDRAVRESERERDWWLENGCRCGVGAPHMPDECAEVGVESIDDEVIMNDNTKGIEIRATERLLSDIASATAPETAAEHVAGENCSASLMRVGDLQ